MADARGGGSDARWFALMPFVFVLLWSTGFIVAKYAAPHAPPLTFLLYRFAGVIVVLLPLAWLTRAPWPRTRRAWLDIAIVGVLLQAVAQEKALGRTLVHVDAEQLVRRRAVMGAALVLQRHAPVFLHALDALGADQAL